MQKASLQEKNWQSYEKKKIGKANLRQRWDQCKFLYIGRFSIFLARGQVCFEFDSAAVKREKKKTKEKKDCGRRQREKISLIFRTASSLEKEIDDCLHLVRRISHAVDVGVRVLSVLASAPLHTQDTEIGLGALV